MSLKAGLTIDPNLSKSCDGISSNIVYPPRKLSDHLRWRCSSCKSLVTTKETHFHLIECLRTFLDPMRKVVIRGVTKSESDVDDLTMSPTNSKVNINSTTGTVIRPQTRVIRRPTPHLKHPVISESGNRDQDRSCKSESGNRDQDRSCKRREKSENRMKSFHDRFLTHNLVGKTKSLDPTLTINNLVGKTKSLDPTLTINNPVGKTKSLDPTPTIKIDTCKSVTKDSNKSTYQEDGNRLLAKLTLQSPTSNNNNNKSIKDRKKVSRTVSQRNLVPESEPDPEWLEHLTQLKPCRKCKRTFFPERLLVHEPTCNAEPLKMNPINLNN